MFRGFPKTWTQKFDREEKGKIYSKANTDQVKSGEEV